MVGRHKAVLVSCVWSKYQPKTVTISQPSLAQAWVSGPAVIKTATWQELEVTINYTAICGQPHDV